LEVLKEMARDKSTHQIIEMFFPEREKDTLHDRKKRKEEIHYLARRKRWEFREACTMTWFRD